MDYKRKYRWALAGFIIMLALNLAVVGTIWYMKSDRDHRGRDRTTAQKLQRFVERELQLTEEQQQEYGALVREHLKKSRELRAEISNYRNEIYQNMNDTTTAPTRVDSLAEKIGATQAELERALYGHFEEVRSLCTPEQKERFERMIEKLLARIHSDGRKRPGRDKKENN